MVRIRCSSGRSSKFAQLGVGCLALQLCLSGLRATMTTFAAVSSGKTELQPPKRALSAYLLYTKDVRPEFAAKGGKLTEVSKAMGAAWKELSEDDAAKYHQMAAKDKERYAEEKAAFEKAGGVMPKVMRKTTKASTTKAKTQTKMVKKKAAPSAYTVYMKAHLADAYKALAADAPRSDAMKTVAAAWKALGDADKQEYIKKAEETKKALA
eukprot:TRINITY_DN10004_c0_g1_i2.p1 TRINITY_DN10004_c0_g1~~TRINITY_DN10004_c0_g1_i2.p1  ORF type:complete len:210 (-),score=71.62 TRINITY_DN10004_c0_g1_i2:226-855(-)